MFPRITILSGLIVMGLWGCYDKPPVPQPPVLGRSCVEYQVQGSVKRCSAYRFATDPLHVATVKAAVLLETPSHSPHYWVYEAQRREVLMQEVASDPRKCGYGLLARTLRGPEKNSDPVRVILYDVHQSRHPGDFFHLKELCGVLHHEGGELILIGTESKCPGEPTLADAQACLATPLRKGLTRVEWSGARAKQHFERTHRYYLDAYVGLR